MRRAQIVREKAEEIIGDGEKPSARRISRELDFTESDVHRCLNFLEKQGEIRTYTSELLGERLRMIGVNRE